MRLAVKREDTLKHRESARSPLYRTDSSKPPSYHCQSFTGQNRGNCSQTPLRIKRDKSGLKGASWFLVICSSISNRHHHHHLSLNREGRWGTTDDFATSFLHFFPVLRCPLGLGEPQARPFPDVVFPPLPLSALSSSPCHRALQDGFGQT